MATVVLDLPDGNETCELAIINATCDLTSPAATLIEPVIPGHDFLNLPTLSFLMKHQSSGAQILFDLGCRKDFWNLPPPISSVIDSHVPAIGFDVENVQAAIMSHHHYDHVGDPKELPKSVDLIVGPGFKSNFYPGYPTSQASLCFEAAFEGRTVREIDFINAPTIGGFDAYDYFGDGSMYILNVPGHAIGHICGLVRTTPTTFAFLGAHTCHFAGAFRPTPDVPLPDTILPEADLDASLPSPCPCSIFTKLHPDQAKGRMSPYYKPYSAPDSWYVNPAVALESTNKLKSFDASEDVLVVIAHDPSVIGVVPFFPDGKLNEWQKNGWKEICRWRFLRELPMDGNSRPVLVDGTYRDGIKIKTLHGRVVS
ncbi:hypothetical protein BDV96DRAFT_611627 [Lophiotrema nucula]|uniref:Metallo-beta-lactamase domain-containing protein n=1 Tax=Lophiotrema nucula TaxID=690887 RepID=A0A6A5ZC36_9PLEO|nr:hypothetical protein BDV96DRAFT_611627 [Lophiotrema nucula]